jgi:hypothetical protein
VERRRLRVYFQCLARRICKSVVTLAVTGITISCRVVSRRRMQVLQWLRLPLAGSRWMGHTVAERSWEDADFVCISCI